MPRRFSRHRYSDFVADYRARRLDATTEDNGGSPSAHEQKKSLRDPGRRAYLREYIRWLKPHRTALISVSFLALIVAGLQMIEPLFMRFIIDRVILAKGLDQHARIVRLQLAGAAFVVVV